MAQGYTARQPDTARANLNREFPIDFGRTRLENRPKPSGGLPQQSQSAAPIDPGIRDSCTGPQLLCQNEQAPVYNVAEPFWLKLKT